MVVRTRFRIVYAMLSVAKYTNLNVTKFFFKNKKNEKYISSLVHHRVVIKTPRACVTRRPAIIRARVRRAIMGRDWWAIVNVRVWSHKKLLSFVHKFSSLSVCPNGTYWHSWNLCKPCSDINHITSEFPALNASYCVCKSGFKADQHNRCEILRCPMLRPPENGYFVKHPLGCDRVLNTACGARCKSGYELIGSSIRVCGSNGTWSGIEAKCVCKCHIYAPSIEHLKSNFCCMFFFPAYL